MSRIFRRTSTTFDTNYDGPGEKNKRDRLLLDVPCQVIFTFRLCARLFLPTSTVKRVLLIFICPLPHAHLPRECLSKLALGFKYAMSGQHLHIWPRGEFMMIALPNDDNTFTGNIFAPFSTLDKLKTPQELLDFYQEQFPDLLELIGKEKLVKDYFEREPKTLISIKVYC